MTEMTVQASKWSFPYQRPFSIDRHDCKVITRSGMAGNESILYVDGVAVARDYTPPTGAEGARNHTLEHTLPDGRVVSVEAGYINWWNIGIAVRVDGELSHESHPGRTIAMPESAKKMMESSGDPANYDPEVWQRNRIPIAVDIVLGLVFFVVAKMTDLTTAAFVGAAVGILLLIVQRITKIDLLGGLAMFGIVMLLVSAGLALAFQSDEAVKYRTTVLGLITASLFFIDGLTGGKHLAKRFMTYLPYKDIHPARLAIGMAVLGVIMALANQAVAMLTSTDVWLFYTTFGDFLLTVALIFSVFRYSRGELWPKIGPRYRRPEPDAEPTSDTVPSPAAQG